MREVLKMSSQERERKAFFEMVKQGQLTIKQASVKSGLSYRQGRRVYQSYLKKGDAGLTHKNRGRPSNRKNPHQEIIIALYQEKYEGFGPTLAAEYLESDLSTTFFYPKIRENHDVSMITGPNEQVAGP